MARHPKLWLTPDQFDEEWKYAEEHGYCDGLGGAEYNRVRAAWLAEEPRPAAPRYILWACNRPPGEHS